MRARTPHPISSSMLALIDFSLLDDACVRTSDTLVTNILAYQAQQYAIKHGQKIDLLNISQMNLSQSRAKRVKSNRDNLETIWIQLSALIGKLTYLNFDKLNMKSRRL